jgi:CRP-like cAMP-binding protein
MKENRSNCRILGEYLLDAQACSPEVIEESLSHQSRLQEKNIYEPLGNILLDHYNLNPKSLESALNEQRFDLVSSTELFCDLKPQLQHVISSKARDKILPADTTIFLEGESGDSFYLLVSGEVEVHRSSDDGTEIFLSKLEPGDGFGEMALITGAARSASVRTVKPCSLIIVDKTDFDQIMNSHPDTYLQLARIMANRLAKGNAGLAKVATSESAFRKLISDQDHGLLKNIIGSSRLGKQLRDRITELSPGNLPIWLNGPKGSEFKMLAGIVANRSATLEKSATLKEMQKERKTHPSPRALLIFDARSSKKQDKNADVSEEALSLAQYSMIFGQVAGVLSIAPEGKPGLLTLAENGVLLIENADDLCDTIQIELARFISTGKYKSLGGIEQYSNTRIIISTVDHIGKTEDADIIDELEVLLTDQQVRVPALKRRKKDLQEISVEIVSRAAITEGLGSISIDREALNSLLNYEWPGNLNELEIVLSRAVKLCKSDCITEEHLFITNIPGERRKGINLLRYPWFNRLMLSAYYPFVLRVFAAFFMVLIPLLAVIPNGSTLALVLAWGIWEPLIVALTFLMSRIWCAACPVGVLAEAIGPGEKKASVTPGFLRNNGHLFQAGGLGAIVWVEFAADMPASVSATAWLILAITLLALIVSGIFGGRSWCRYMCPLGSLVGVLSSCSLISVRANHSVCNNDCKDHLCHHGSENYPGCKMYGGPFALRSSMDCILCGDCIKTCPNQGPRVDLRPPAQELFIFREPNKTLVTIANVLIASQLMRAVCHNAYITNLYGIERWGFSAALLLLFVFAVYSLTTISQGFVFGQKTKSFLKGGLFSYILLPLAFSFELSWQLGRMIEFLPELIPATGIIFGFTWQAPFAGSLPANLIPYNMVLICCGILSSLLLQQKLQFTHANSKKLKMTDAISVLFVGLVYMGLLL